MIKSISFILLTHEVKIKATQVTYFFKLKLQYFFTVCVSAFALWRTPIVSNYSTFLKC